jgi:formylglycine-generating enzyme required for sulfatase activity
MNKKLIGFLSLFFIFFCFLIYSQKEKNLEEMVLIPAGEFIMGGDEGTECPKCTTNRLPKHKVFLRSYYIDKYEVTNSQYKKCVDAKVCEPPGNIVFYLNPEYSNHPVVNVNWHQAHTYCKWKGKRLPTEAEWEKAARGTDERIYVWGNEWNKNNCNNWNYEGEFLKYMANMNKNRGTLPVGIIEEDKSFYGVMDMAGNVMEWVSDWYDEDYYKTSPEENPTGPKEGTFKILRGGHWAHNIKTNFQVTNRIKTEPEHWYYTWGFRCVRDIYP